MFFFVWRKFSRLEPPNWKHFYLKSIWVNFYVPYLFLWSCTVIICQNMSIWKLCVYFWSVLISLIRYTS
jgi:hypothetical protein